MFTQQKFQDILPRMKKLKFAFVVWLFVWPLISILSLLVKSLIPTAPHLVFTFVMTAIFVPIMVYIIVPFVTKLLSAKK